jgi:hypothetical protein
MREEQCLKSCGTAYFDPEVAVGQLESLPAPWFNVDANYDVVAHARLRKREVRSDLRTIGESAKGFGAL